MSCRLIALSIDANDPLRLARFWSGVLGGGFPTNPNPRKSWCFRRTTTRDYGFVSFPLRN